MAPTGLPAADDLLIGILGGMGPAATADFFAKLVRATPAATDQQHPRVVIWSDPTVPDRTAALLDGGPDPTPWLLRGTRILKEAGASFIAVPCNTAHAFIPAVEEATGVRVIHMMRETALQIAAMRPGVRRVGLLATTGTVRAGLYQDWLSRSDIDVVTPAADEQRRVMGAIRHIKAGHTDSRTTALLAAAAQHLHVAGAQVLIAGCTEIPLVLTPADVSIPLVDPTDVLARAVVAAAREPRCREHGSSPPAKHCAAS